MADIKILFYFVKINKKINWI